MRKTMKLALLVCLALLACALMLTACDSGNKPQTPSGATDGNTIEDSTTVGATDGNTTEDSTMDGATDGTTEPETEAHVHSFGEWSTVKEATCTEKGEQERACSCGEKETQSTEMVAHTEVTDEAVAPTCTETGLTEGKHCSVCSTVLVAQKTVPTLDHYWLDATCTEPKKCDFCDQWQGHPAGHSSDSGVCDTCGIEYYSPYKLALKEEDQRYQQDLDSLLDEKAVVVARTELLEQQKENLGISTLYSYSYYQNKLSEIENKMNQNIQKMFLSSTTAAEKSRLQAENEQLQEDYSYYYSCQSLISDEENIKLLIEAIEDITKEFDITHQINIGKIEEEFSSEYAIAQEVHQGLDSTMLIEPTCTEDGSQQFTCRYCGYVVSVTHSALGHDVVQATCTTPEHCTVCQQEFSPATGHNWLDATCTESAYCDRCWITEGEALGHSLTEHEGAAPSCSSVGYTDYVSCSNCTYTTYQEISKLPHTCPGGWTIIKQAEYYSEGIKIAVCDYCGDVEETIPRIPCSDGLAFGLNSDGTYRLIGLGTCTDTCVVIPDVYNGIPVTEISDSLIMGETSHVTEIVVPPSVTKIKSGAFISFDNLEKITLPFVGTTPNGQTFFCSIFGAYNYRSAIFPKTLKTVVITNATYIDEYAFYSCNSIENIVLNEGIQSIGQYAFSYCTSLKGISIPDSVLEVGSYVFTSCENLTEVKLGKGVAEIPYQAFGRCSQLTTVEFTNSVTYFSTGAFLSCGKISEFHYNGTVTEWGLIDKGPCLSYIEFTAPWDYHIKSYTIHCTNGTITK